MTKKIAIIGAGKMAQAHLDVLVGMDDVEVVAVNDSKIPMILALNKLDLIEELQTKGESL